MEAATGSGAVGRRLPPQLQRIVDLPLSRKLMLGGACLAILAIIAAILLWNQEPEYGVLFSNLEDKDGGEVINALTAQNIPYQVGDNGHAILVPADRVHEMRLNLATQGLPKGGAVGFELMDNQKLGISQFAEQVNYQRSLEGELSKTIASLAVVRDAKVHLAIPKPSVFIRDNEKPSASVLLTMHPGRVLDETQIMGITHLISSSVPNMPNTGVRIVDQNGNLLNPFKDESARAGLDGKQLLYVRNIEEEMVKRIEKILEPTSGPGNTRAQVTVDIDFSQVEQTEETYKPNSEPNEQAIRSRTSREAETVKPVTGGVPGAFSNQPPQPPQAPIATDNAPPLVTGQPGGSPLPADQLVGTNAGNRNLPSERMRESTQNFELDKKVTHIQNAIGNNVRRLTAAVIVNNKKIVDNEGNVTHSPYTEEELTKVTDLVRQAVGFDPKRGDTVSVANIAFDPDVVGKELSFWDYPDKVKSLEIILGEVIKYLIALILALYLIFGVIRPIMNPPAPPEEEPLALAGLGQSPYSLDQPEEPEPEPELVASGTGQDVFDEEEKEDEEESEEEIEEEAEEETEEEQEQERSSGIEKFLVQRPAYQSDLDFARELALAEPKIVAKAVRDWMSSQ